MEFFTFRFCNFLDVAGKLLVFIDNLNWVDETSSLE